MTEEEHALLLMKGTVADLPEEDRVRVHQAAASLRATLDAYGKHGLLALALVGAEKQAGR